MAIEANVKMLTTNEVAEGLGVKPDTVRKYVQRKLIKPDRMIGNAHIFLESEFKRFSRTRRKAGNPAFSRVN
jgi:DNA-binding transcriptional MerR regulator